MTLRTRVYFLVIHSIVMAITGAGCILFYRFETLSHSLGTSVAREFQICLDHVHIACLRLFSENWENMLVSVLCEQDTVPYGCVCPTCSTCSPHATL